MFCLFKTILIELLALRIGVRSGGENNVMRLNNTKIHISFGSVYLDLGVRLNAPKILKRGWHNTATRHLGL